VRIRNIVSTMVRITTSVAPKLRASSRRRVESNNIRRFPWLRRIMDFKTQLAGPWRPRRAGTERWTDALLRAGGAGRNAVPAEPGPPLAEVLAAA
jgi:hypothetical protein